MNETHLTPEQLEQFETEGYLILPALFDEAELRRMQEEADRMLELMINSSLALGRQSARLDWVQRENRPPIVRKIQPVNDLSDYFTEISNDSRLLDPMRDIMGDEPILMEEKLNYKQPLAGEIAGLQPQAIQGADRFPVHNDWAYYKAQNYPQEIVSSAISLDQSTPKNGPLHVWPGSHKTHLEHENLGLGLGLQVLPGLIDFEGGLDILAPAGSVMLFHSLLVHNSRPNETDQPRRLMIYSHYPSRFNLGDDVRNGPMRVQERPYEQQYLTLLKSGDYSNQYSLHNG